MKQFLIAILLFPIVAIGQVDFSGQWKASLMGLDMYIQVTNDPSLTATIPIQGVYDEPADNVEFKDSRIDFYIKKFGGSYYGDFRNDSIIGTWSQAGRNIELVFLRNSENIVLSRPQEPKGPFDYNIEDVIFESTEPGIMMAGTITKPKGDGPFPAIILISGSGPQTRDCDLLMHKPFWVLADYFTKKGYAVLRYDDRGVNESLGKFRGATSADLSNDAEGAFLYMEAREDIDSKRTGFVGHSEGGMIAPIIGARNKDVDFMVLLAGPGIPRYDLMEYQLIHSYEVSGLSSDAVNKARDFVPKMLKLLMRDEPNDKIVDEFQGLANQFFLSLTPEDQQKIGKNEQMFYFSMAPSFLDPWMRYFLKYNPEDNLKKVQVPVLAVNGKKDVQVTAKENIKGIKSALKAGGNKDVKVKCFKNKNHLFQNAKTGEGSEYASITETFSPDVMEYVVKWLDKEVKNKK